MFLHCGYKLYYTLQQRMASEEAVALLLSEVRKLREGQEAMRSAQEETSHI